MAKPAAVSGVNPDLLVWARERSGKTVAEVAATLKKQMKVIEGWEHGVGAPTYVQLETLAYKVYRRPLALFFFPEPPDEPDPEHSFRTLPKSEIQDLEADTRFRIREAHALQVSLGELTGGANPALKRIWRDLGDSAPSSAPAMAESARAYLNIGVSVQKRDWKDTDEAMKAWRGAVESAGIFVFKDSFKQRSVSGFALYDDQFPLIVINNSTAITRQIFTVFHELGHLLVHTNGVTKNNDQYIRLLTGESRHIEVFCNEFAAEFLVPLADLRAAVQARGTGDIAVSEIAKLYKVSREMILRRCMDLGLVTRQYYQRKAAQWLAEYEASLAARRSGGNYYLTHASYLSERYADLAFGRYYRGDISVEQLASYLNVSPKSVAGIEQVVLQRAPQ